MIIAFGECEFQVKGRNKSDVEQNVRHMHIAVMPMAVRLCIEIMCFMEKITIDSTINICGWIKAKKKMKKEKKNCWHLLESERIQNGKETGEKWTMFE